MGKVMGVDPLIGQIIGGRYEVVRLIGRGGMGAIYEVRNTRVGRAFAMKTLIGQAASDAEVLARFRREADVVARIKHPHIVEVIDWETLEDDSPCIILEYLEGSDLAQRIRLGAPLPWPFIALVGDQILSALSVAHAAGVIHRDLKPQNIFLALDDSGEERAKLLDFGVSKIRDSRSLVTTDARLLGTPSYMSPEQAEGRHDDVGPATDLWAMGAILYEMATGELAFDGASMPAVLYRICSKDADSVDGRRPDAPQAFTALIRETLARDVADRITDADVLRVRLREALASVANVRYSDQLIAPRTRPTPLPSSERPTPRKRHTGAHEKTLSSAETNPIATANTVASGAFDPPEMPTPIGVGEVSTNTLAPRRRGLPIILGVTAAVMAVVAVIAMTSNRESAPVDAVVTPVVMPAKPTVVVVDAGVPVVEIDAAVVAVEPPPPPPRPAKPRRMPKDPVPPPVKVEPPKPDPPKPQGCERYAKTDPKYQLCIYGDGGGN